MRLATTSTNREQIEQFQHLLDEQDIRHTLETEDETSWESDNYGSTVYSLWINNDDDFARAKELLRTVEPTPVKSRPDMNATFSSPLQQFLQQKFRLSTKEKKQPSAAFWTLSFLFICIGLFIADNYQASTTASPIRKTFLFDYPDSFSAQEKGEKPLPHWKGLYTYTLSSLAKKEESPSRALFAEKIQEGEIWRLITPIFLHGDLIHLLFNMMWLIFLGGQLEEKLPKSKFFLLIAILATISNTAQYIMTGPLFIGFSGVACGMIGFIHARQEKAPWEAYALTPSTYSFVFFFIWSLAALSLCTFFTEATLGYTIPIGFANTAHVTGLLTGSLFGRLSWFTQQEGV